MCLDGYFWDAGLFADRCINSFVFATHIQLRKSMQLFGNLMIPTQGSHSCASARPGTPFGRFGPLSYTLKLTNGSDQNFMDPLNFKRHGMSIYLLPSCSHQTLSLAIQKHLKVNKLYTENQEICFRWVTFRTFSLDPLIWVLQSLKGLEKFSRTP